jgi:hypothetical protein
MESNPSCEANYHYPNQENSSILYELTGLLLSTQDIATAYYPVSGKFNLYAQRLFLGSPF